MEKINSISIKFKPDFYGQFENFSNKVWNVIGEYVDNALQSYESNKVLLKKTHNRKYTLEVRITLDKDNDLISISDNAAGIDSVNIVRALEVANTHADVSGLNEFGMGLKTSSNWLSKSWSLRTTALGEKIERYVEFDLNDVKKNKLEELPIKSKVVDPNAHYTILTLRNLTKNAPSNHQLDKIKKHLASIYRKFIRKGEMKLFINDVELEYHEPEILNAPFYKNPNGTSILWKKEINFSSGIYKVKGFIGILNKMSTNELNGLSLFRRGRVIEGSHDEKYRPKVLCGYVGSPRHKRIFGELELEGFTVSFNKGSFQEQEELDALMAALHSEISAKDFDLYTQAEKYIKPKTQESNKRVAEKIITNLRKSTKESSLKANVKASLKEINSKNLASKNERILKKALAIESHEDFIEFDNEKYILKLELITEPSLPVLYSMEQDEDELFTKKILYKINLSHPFFVRFEQFKKEEDYQPIISIIRSLVLAEIKSPSQGTKNAGNVRINFNHFLRNI
jgi:hypothetical protein